MAQRSKFCKGKALFLGSGASTGVPVIGCHCNVCMSRKKKNHRLRSSMYLEVRGKKILIDVCPDFRQQALLYNVAHPDAIFLTHTHYDHLGGLEELRVYNVQSPRSIACYLSEESYEAIRKMFYYLFTPKGSLRSFSVQLDFHVLSGQEGVFSLQGMPVHYFSYSHGQMQVTGCRVGSFSYVTDIKEYSPSILRHIAGSELLVLGASRLTQSHTQMSIEDAVAFCEKVNVQKTYVSHLSHEIDYDEISKCLPRGMNLAYDGLKVDFSYET